MLHICNIAVGGTDERGEWVSVCNDGSTPETLTGLEITDYTQTQQHVHVYRFPSAQGGAGLTLAPGGVAFVFTGHGVNERLRTPRGNDALLLFTGRSASVWNNTGDVAYLRHAADGRFVDTKTVGSPARHPNGH
jgi:hypothetical protein